MPNVSLNKTMIQQGQTLFKFPVKFEEMLLDWLSKINMAIFLKASKVTRVVCVGTILNDDTLRFSYRIVYLSWYTLNSARKSCTFYL